ncbi:MAG TPA: efflux RND transporter periplasmic adaptor subunit [Caulobacteraceae bacterium]|nr:efflux RND transporter periplasmic adaptor subunit [Caulobacteraceae bacterium]
MKKNLFLVVALCVVGLMVVAGGLKLAFGGSKGAGGAGAPAAPAAAPRQGAGAAGQGGQGGQGARRGTQVTATAAQVRTFTDRIEVLGAAKARQSITVTAAAQQLISKVHFKSGDHVRQGQVLVELVATEQDAGVVQAQSAVNLAKSNWDRWQKLADRGIAPAATAEQYKAQYDQAVATLGANRARLGDRVIRAPFSGTVGLTDAAPGMLVNPGGAIVTLDDMTAMNVDFPVAERFIPVLKDGLVIDATADAYPATTFHGRIAKVDTRLDPATRAVIARAVFPNPDGRLKPGMLLHVTIDQAVRQSPAIPEESVVFENGEAYVLLIQRPEGGQGGGPARPAGGAQAGQARPAGGAQGGGQGGRGGNMIAVRHVIGTGLRKDGWVEVTSGLNPGQQIVADGSNRVRPNDPVQIVGGGGQGGQRGAGGAAQGAPAATGGRAVQTQPGAVAGAGARGGGDLMATFTAADANKDGAVTLAEWTAAGRQEAFFGRMDANGDGRITRAEVQTFTASRAAGGGDQGRQGGPNG